MLGVAADRARHADGLRVGVLCVGGFGCCRVVGCRPVLGQGLAGRGDRCPEYGEGESDGARREDYSVIGTVEFLTAPRPVEEEAEPEPGEACPRAARAGRGLGASTRAGILRCGLDASRTPSVSVDWSALLLPWI